MKPIERAIYNIAVLVTPEQGDELVALLEQAGLHMRDDVADPNLAIRSRLLPIAGGGYIEVANELEPGSFGHPGFFAVTPRPAVICYTTLDGAADLAHLRVTTGSENAFGQAGSWTSKQGRTGYYAGVMPAPPDGAIFFALQERRLFPPIYQNEARTAPAVRRILVRGPNAVELRGRNAEWFSLPERDGKLWAGDTELLFEETVTGDDEAFITLAVPNPKVAIRLAAGGFDFLQA